jgi:hypothetical protein
MSRINPNFLTVGPPKGLSGGNLLPDLVAMAAKFWLGIFID